MRPGCSRISCGASAHLSLPTGVVSATGQAGSALVFWLTSTEARMARAIWKGSLAFGLVNIPVELFSAVARSSAEVPAAAREGRIAGALRARLSDGRQARRRGKISSRATSTPRASSSSSPRTISRPPRSKRPRQSTSSTSSIPKEIDERYFETPYYLQPAKGAERAYALLREAHPRLGPRRHRQDHPARRAAPRGGRGDRRCAGPDDDAIRRRARGSGGFHVSAQGATSAPPS